MRRQQTEQRRRIGVQDVIAEHKLKPVAVILSHGHLDHMWSVVPCAKSSDVPPTSIPATAKLLADPLSGISGETRLAFESMTVDICSSPNLMRCES